MAMMHLLKVVRSGLVLVGAMAFAASAHAALIATQTNYYAYDGNPTAVTIVSNVYDNVGSYLWEYTVTNSSYDPEPGFTNGFSGFELALPGGFPPDLGNVTGPNANWESNCCSGLPMEWDIRTSVGLGIMPGESGVFSFTTLPRGIQTADDGWFHTWQVDAGTLGPLSESFVGFDVQTYLVYYEAGNAPLAPDLLRAPLPAPATLALLGIGLAALSVAGRRKR